VKPQTARAVTVRIANGPMLHAVLAGAVALLAVCACSTSARAKKRDDAANYNMQLGMAYMNRGDLALAKQKLDRALQENPGDPSVHSAEAMLQDRLGNSAKADEEFKEALRLAPGNPEIQNNYAVYLCRTGRTDAGVKSFEEAAHNGLYRTPEVAYTNAGVCLRTAHLDTQAAMSFMRALHVKPDFSEAAYQLADLDLQRGEVVEARTEIDRFLAAFDATPDLLLLGVRVAHKQGDRMAEEHFARKLRMEFPTSEQARELGGLHNNSG
jgi:type IV pilus assembly protein PilF